MQILAIDPGYDRLGVAILDKSRGEKEELLFSDCVLSSKTLSHPKRLLHVGETLQELIALWHPEAVVLEDLFFSNNQKTALLVAETRGVIMYVAEKAHLPIFQFTPTQIKVAVTGNGHSDKKQVGFMVEKLIHFPKIRKKKMFDDEYDAIAVGLTFYAREKHTLLSTEG